MVKIGQFAAEYRIPGKYAAVRARDVKDRLDRLIHQDLTRALAARLYQHDAVSSESVWMIRSLQADIVIDSRAAPERIAERWADAIARQFERAVAQNDFFGDVIRFDGEAALVVRYILEQARGSAAGAWYFRRFEGLAVLPASSAIRTVLTEDVRLGFQAAALASAHEWLAIASVLSEADAARILSVWSAAVVETPAIERLWRLWRVGAFHASSTAQESRTALRLTVAALQESAESPAPAGARALTRFARLCGEYREPLPGQFVQAVAEGNVPLLYQLFGVEESEPLRALAGAPRTLLEEVAAAVRCAPADRGMTRFGGVFLMLPLLAEMPFEAMACGDPALMRFFTVKKCFGGSRGEEFLADPTVRYLLGIPTAVSLADAAEYLKECSRHVGRASAILDDWLRREDYVSGVTATVGIPGRRLHVTSDLARGIWMALSKRAPADAIAPPEACSLQMRRLGLAGAELNYLDFPSRFQASERVDLFFSRLANVLLRNLSWRLPGFHGSTIPYLAANFLDMHANLERGEGILKASLGRPPLHVILNIAGMMQCEYRVPWIADCTIAVSAEVP